MEKIITAGMILLIGSLWAAESDNDDAAHSIFVYQSAITRQENPDMPGDHMSAPIWIPARFGVKILHYTNATITSGWETVALNSPLWMITRSDILKRTEAVATLAAFFKSGGTLYLHHFAFPLDAAESATLEKLGVRIPVREASPANYHVVINDAEAHPLLRAPHDLAALMEKDVKYMPPSAGRDAFFAISREDAAAGVRALMLNRDDPKQVAMAVQEGVQGAGRVIFSAMPVLNLRPRVYNFDRIIIQRWTENLLTLVFGELTLQAAELSAEEAVAADTVQQLFSYPALDVPADQARDINPLYLRVVGEIPWWDARWAQRIPVLVFEPLGVARAGLPATIDLDIGTAAPESIRVVTPWGAGVAFQTRIDREKGGKVQVTFAADYLAHEHRVFFVYFGGGVQPETDVESDLVVREYDDRIELINCRLRAVLRRDEPRLVYLAPRFNPTGNQLNDFHGMWPDGSRYIGSSMDLNPARPGAGRVAERGSVRTVIEYPAADGMPALTITLYAGARRLEWRASGAGLRYSTSWMPGRGGFGLQSDTPSDILRWTQGGVVKRTPVNRAGVLVERFAQTPGVDDWYAFEDTRTGQTVGEVFDANASPALKISQDFMGLDVDVRWTDAGAWRGAWVPLPEGSGYLPLAREARAFRHPVQALTGARTQAREDAPAAPRVPVFGRDLIRGYHRSLAARGRPLPAYAGGDAPWGNIPHLLEWTRSRGGNYLSFYVATPMWRSKYQRNETQAAYLGKLLEMAHARGVGVQWGGTLMLWKIGKTSGNSIFFGEAAPPGFMESRADMLQFRDLAVEIAAELAAYDIDMYWLFEETKYTIANEHDPSGFVREYGRAAFRKEYGMEPATPLRVHQLNEPAHHNTFFFEMDAYSDVVEDMTRAIKRVNPKIIMGDSDAASTMSRIPPHDWERHSDFFDMQSMDIWGAPCNRYKWYRKMMRAMFNNRGASGLLSMAGTRDMALSQDHQMMWGTQSLIYFGPCRVDTWAQVYDEVKLNFQFYEYTGLGDLIARAQPAKRIALLRDRAGIMADIRQGRWLHAPGDYFGTDYDVRLQKVMFMPHFQCDLVMSKYFTLENIKEYPALFLASYDMISDDFARVIEAYLAQGGKVFAEGDTIKNTYLQKLVGVRRTGDAREAELVLTGDDDFTFQGWMTEVVPAGAQVRAKAQDGTPVLFEQALGKGCVIYSPLWLSERADDLAVGAFFRGVVDGLAGRFKVRLVGSAASRLDSNLLVSDGGIQILGVYNPTDKGVAAELRWDGDEIPPLLADFSRGPLMEFKGSAPISIPARRVIFWALGDAQTLKIPLNVTQDQ